jgi:hypothetical protein
MGLSSSRSRTTTNQNTTQNETSSGTQTPITPPWLTEAAEDYVGRIGAFGDMDPNSFVAPASPLQRTAWQNAIPAMSGWQGQAQTAAGMAQTAGTMGPNYAGMTPQAAQFLSQMSLTGSRAPQGTGGGMQAPRDGAAQPGPAFQAQAFGYAAPRLGPASLVSGQGYAMPNLGSASGYAAPRIGQPIGAFAQGYNPALVGNVGIDPATNAAAATATGMNVAERIGAYQNPYQQQVIDTTLAQLDRSGREQQARLAAQGARSGAFGGSRFGIAEGQLAADLALGRAGTEAGLRSQGFNTAAGLAAQDAAMFNDISRFNAGNQTNVSLANADAANSRALSQAGLTLQSGLANMDAANQAGAFGAAARNQASLFNAGEGNRMTLAQAGLDSDAARFGAEANNQFALSQAGMEQRTSEFNADAANRAGLANQAAQNQFGLTQAGLDGDAGQFNAQNQTNISQFNAGANNNMSQFNAGQADTAAQRALQAAALLQSGAGQYAGDTRADLQTMAALGDQQRAVEQAYALAPLAQLEAMGQLSGMTPYDILVGRQINGTTNATGTQQGTSVTRTSPSLFNQLMGIGSLVGSFIPGA